MIKNDDRKEEVGLKKHRKKIGNLAKGERKQCAERGKATETQKKRENLAQSRENPM